MNDNMSKRAPASCFIGRSFINAPETKTSCTKGVGLGLRMGPTVRRVLVQRRVFLLFLLPFFLVLLLQRPTQILEDSERGAR